MVLEGELAMEGILIGVSGSEGVLLANSVGMSWKVSWVSC